MIIGPVFVHSIRSICPTRLHLVSCHTRKACFTQRRNHHGVEIGRNALSGADIVQPVHQRIRGSGARRVDCLVAGGVTGRGGELDRLDWCVDHTVK